MRSAISSQEATMLLVIMISVVVAIALATSSETQTRRSKRRDRAAGALGMIVSTVLVLMAAIYAIPHVMAWP
jgi:multisubunit Na+/H+ antiporter MnhB subunit